MSYIVLDLEWNQAMSSKSSVYLRLPIHLRGEIIQIGAVKLQEDGTPGEEFQCDVRPVWFRKMHRRVKQLTGFDEARLERGLPFAEAMRRFWDFCGDDCVFMTWGYDDFGIMEQNCILHDLDIDWMGRWYNLQLIYNYQTDGDRNQKSLETAMEHFSIPQTRTAHDALGDAYNTGLVCSRLDIARGIRDYDEILRRLTHRVTPREEGDSTVEPYEHILFDMFNSREAVWNSPQVTEIACPDCGAPLKHGRWVSQGDKRYMTLAACEEHGTVLLRIRMRHEEDDTWSVNRLLYRADEQMIAFFHAKEKQPRRRSHKKKSTTVNKPAAR